MPECRHCGHVIRELDWQETETCPQCGRNPHGEPREQQQRQGAERAEGAGTTEDIIRQVATGCAIAGLGGYACFCAMTSYLQASSPGGSNGVVAGIVAVVSGGGFVYALARGILQGARQERRRETRRKMEDWHVTQRTNEIVDAEIPPSEVRTMVKHGIKPLVVLQTMMRNPALVRGLLFEDPDQLGHTSLSVGRPIFFVYWGLRPQLLKRLRTEGWT